MRGKFQEKCDGITKDFGVLRVMEMGLKKNPDAANLAENVQSLRRSFAAEFSRVMERRNVR